MPGRTPRHRLSNALWGLFAGDALAMPVHWYYSRENIRREFDGGVTRYEDARHPHPEAFMIGMSYQPDVERAASLDRPFDILHEHVRFYRTSYTGEPEIALTDREGEHGNAVAGADQRYHYHHGLKAGENTLAAHLVRVLMRSVIAAGRYDQDRFLADFIAFMTGPGHRSDPYTEIYLRRWFENYSQGLPAAACAEHQRDVWSIGSHGGMIRPLVLALLGADDPYQATGMALEHQNLTHRSENVAAAVAVTVPMLADLLGADDTAVTWLRHAARVRPPVVTGKELYAVYRDAGGPGNIPRQEMWRLHTEMTPTPLDLVALDSEATEDIVVMGRFATACYPEQGLPLLLYLGHHHDLEVEASLLANANAGGDNVHRGMVQGLLVGAACDTFPTHLQTGLRDHEELTGEINAFVDLAVSGRRLF